MLEYLSDQIQQIIRQVCNCTTSRQSVAVGLLYKGSWLYLYNIDLTLPVWCKVVWQRPRPQQL